MTQFTDPASPYYFDTDKEVAELKKQNLRLEYRISLLERLLIEHIAKSSKVKLPENYEYYASINDIRVKAGLVELRYNAIKKRK